MSNLVLYRKYRPQKFAEVVGQPHVVTTIINAISQEKIAHAYLFCGPRGCGKTTIARLLAKAVNCEKKDSPEPCNQCPSCKEIIQNRAIDIIEIDAASHRGIDEVREIRESVRFSPTKLKYKVFILDESHQLTSGAENALLKVLEEAPEHVIFVLATTEPHKMTSTVVSRCQRFDFRKITVKEIVDRLKKIIKKEGYKGEEEALLMIASSAGGSLRDAVGLLSQVLAFIKEGDTLKREDVKELLGVVEKQIIGDFIDFLIEGEAIKAINIIEEALNQGVDAENFYDNLIYYLREMMILKIVARESDEEKRRSLTEALLSTLTQEEIDRIKEQGEKLELEKIKQAIDIFFDAGTRIKHSPIPQLPLEVAVAEIAENLKKFEK